MRKPPTLLHVTEQPLSLLTCARQGSNLRHVTHMWWRRSLQFRRPDLVALLDNLFVDAAHIERSSVIPHGMVYVDLLKALVRSGVSGWQIIRMSMSQPRHKTPMEVRSPHDFAGFSSSSPNRTVKDLGGLCWPRHIYIGIS